MGFLFFILIKKTSRINLHYCSTCVREGAVRTTQQQKKFVNKEHTHIFRVTSVGLTSHSSCETVALVFLTNLTAHTEELFEMSFPFFAWIGQNTFLLKNMLLHCWPRGVGDMHQEVNKSSATLKTSGKQDRTLCANLYVSLRVMTKLHF